MADWEEIKRLAADFQRTQISDTLQRISERNCIDIVKKLTDLNLIELIYTCDGKEFVTPAHLIREIEDEVYVNSGRVHLHELSANLNVDYQHVENKAKDLVREKPDEYNLIQGQVIHSTYKNTLGKQIYDTMIATGQLSIADFAKTLDLPSEFLLTIVKDLLPRVMDDYVASPDDRTYYTSDMMDRYKSVIAGTLSAISKPTTMASIMKKIDIPERLFTSIVEGLIKDGRIDATVENRLFIPSIYAREQNEWIDGFYSANACIEYDVLLRKDIKQPKAFLKKRFPEGVPLKTCFVSPALISQVESLIEDCIASNGLIDISTTLPPSIQPDDIEQMLQDIFKRNKQFAASCHIFNQTNVCSLGYLAISKKSFEDLMQSRAREHLEHGKLVSHFLGGKLKVTPAKRHTQDKDIDEVKMDIGEKKNQEKDEGEEIKNLNKGVGESGQKQKADNDIELTAEDLKREKRNKKSKVEVVEQQDSDEEQNTKKSKSRKSGGGTQGREIKQKAVKKKYFPGNKGSQKVNDDSDEEFVSTSKTPRSNKGRAARRAASPDRPATSSKSKGGHPPNVPEKEPLVFMDTNEIIKKLKSDSRDLGEFTDDIFKLIAKTLEDDLNKTYESLAKEILDDYLRSQAEKENESGEDNDIDLVE